MGYLRPTDGRTLCSRDCHRGRNPPSQEAGTDIWAAFGTPLRAAAAGRVVDVGGSIFAATGYFVTIDLDDGRRIRYLHLWDRYVRVNDRVSRGTIFAQSGGSGYGSMTAAGGAGTVGQHVHVTLWPTHAYDFGTNARTLDFEAFADPIGSTASGGAQPFEEDDMFTDDDRKALNDLLARANGALPGKENGRDQYPRVLDIGDGSVLADKADAVGQLVRDEADAIRKHVDVRINDVAGWTRDDANAIRGMLANLSVAGTDPAKIAAALVPLIPKGASAKEVADEIAKRMVS